MSGFLTFVAFKDGKPAPVPQLLVETAEERAELEAAIARRKQRLERRTPR